MFPTIDKSESFPARELAIGEFWRENDIYHKSLASREGAPPFVFYEGPPTANGMPHPGHCLTRAIKDLFPRYKTMRGYRCERKAGWDTHGLPVEVEVCKEMGIHSKEEIEAFGIEPFIQKCQQSVWRYMQEWRRLTERLGFWVDLDQAYVTYHQSYVESVWWSLKTLFDRGLLYRGHKIVWWWAQGGTALSSGEVGQGYRQVADPSVYVKFPLLDDENNETDTSLLVWTTTPWTLPSNQYVAVGSDEIYFKVTDPDDNGRKLLVAENKIKDLEVKRKVELKELEGPIEGSTLHGLRYRPPFEQYHSKFNTQFSELSYLGYEDAPSRAIRDFFTSNSLLNSVVEGERTHQDNFEIVEERVKKKVSENRIRFHGWFIVPANFVTTDSGTGLVHIAPAYGEDDYSILERELSFVAPHQRGPTLINAVAPNGTFTDEGPEYCRGRWVKDCDKDIIRDLKTRGLLFHQEQYLHDYPFCWRAEEDPLIQYPRESWFIRTTEYKDQMLANNAKINWLPEHIKEGRFGKFLESNVDWALSRERYWGTPLPIWVCDKTGQMEAVGSYEELLAKPGVNGTEIWDEAKSKNPELPDDLRIHKPYIDGVTYESPFAKGARMRRVTEVIDCWYDSGAMPFAQWGYRGQESGLERERFESQFPADFISEALDQTRGWFYSQLAISTLLFGGLGAGDSRLGDKKSPSPQPPYPHPFKNCIVLGLMLGEDGQKMSKSKRNYREPNEIFDKYGADALRWYLFANQPPWTSIRYSEEAIKDSIPEFLLRLWNVYSFFTIYGNIDEFDPAGELEATQADWSLQRPVQLDTRTLSGADSYRPLCERSELDRWILGELNATCATVVERMDAYDNFGACQAITAFIDGLSNWYVRRSRDRFWAKEKRSTDKLDAYWTLYECLLTTTKLIAPFVPFLAERLWQDLAVAAFQGTKGEKGIVESVHLCDYPTGDASATDQSLSEQMNLVRLISSLGRQARSAAELKVRQPLAKVEVILADTTHQSWLEDHAAAISEELNVKAVEFSNEPEKYVDHEVVPNFKLLGPKLGKLMPKVKGVLAKQSGSELLANIQDNGQINLEIDGQQISLTAEEVEFRIQAKPGWTSANDRGVVVVLATEVTPELLAEGWVKDFIRGVQEQRKELGCEFTDRIQIGLVTKSPELLSAIEQYLERIKQETLAVEIVFEQLKGAKPFGFKIGDAEVELYLRVSS
ncbi:isoleucine--tRNA ligase [Bythopirellula polymerisocia]|uniref:Isoleucine--tRNA ligase n=1 Tax=Bythopirellula polymerisocia TaxID=2528003 RepID=A0A5C6CRB9_9BACT|nr:isoleucine--tRNA ligase [Bythopirellula polymerisocia]TWU26094.1 Isoleucine--tRNA ligase [Bythopirellula polymerisocia]